MLLEDIFLNGLKDEINAEIKLYGYDDLSSLMDCALLLEEKNKAIKKRNRVGNEWRGIGSRFRSNGESSRWKEEESKTCFQESEKNDWKPLEGGRGKRLSTVELQEKLKKGLCFKCGDKSSRDHVCKFKHMKLMLCEQGSDIEEDEALEKEEVVELKTL